MAKCKILFLGTRPLGKKVLEFLIGQSNVDIIGVVEPEDSDKYWHENLCSLDVPIIMENELDSIKCDLVISVNYNKVIREPLLSYPSLGCINLHHSHNLRIRGRHSATHAILLARSTGIYIHGSTLHYMSAELDAGRIIASSSIQIKETDTALSLFHKCEDLAMDLVRESLPKAWDGGVITSEPCKDFYSFKKKDLPGKEVDMKLSDLEIYDYVRALSFPPFERPYFVQGSRQYLTINPLEGNIVVVDAGENRKVFKLEEGIK